MHKLMCNFDAEVSTSDGTNQTAFQGHSRVRMLILLLEKVLPNPIDRVMPHPNMESFTTKNGNSRISHVNPLFRVLNRSTFFQKYVLRKIEEMYTFLKKFKV